MHVRISPYIPTHSVQWPFKGLELDRQEVGIPLLRFLTRECETDKVFNVSISHGNVPLLCRPNQLLFLSHSSTQDGREQALGWGWRREENEVAKPTNEELLSLLTFSWDNTNDTLQYIIINVHSLQKFNQSINCSSGQWNHQSGDCLHTFTYLQSLK